MSNDIKSISAPSAFIVESHAMQELRGLLAVRDAELLRVQTNAGQMLAEADMEINRLKNDLVVARQAMPRCAGCDDLRLQAGELRAKLRPFNVLMSRVPIPPNAITWEQGTELLNQLQAIAIDWRPD